MHRSPEPPKTIVETATHGDLAGIAALHRRSFADHFLGRYPEHLLAQFYESFLGSTIFLVARLDAEVAGFVLGGEAERLNECRRDFLRRRAVSFALATALRPKLWAPALERLKSLRSSDSHHGGFRSRTTIRLLSIAVDERTRGKGVAGELVTGFESHLTPGVDYGLSVHDDNERAIGFYRKLGFVEEGRRAGTVFLMRKVAQER